MRGIHKLNKNVFHRTKMRAKLLAGHTYVPMGVLIQIKSVPIYLLQESSENIDLGDLHNKPSNVRVWTHCCMHTMNLLFALRLVKNIYESLIT